MLYLVKNGTNLVINTDQETLEGTEIYVNDYLKFYVKGNTLESERLGMGDEGAAGAYVISKYDDRLLMINRNLFIQTYGQYFGSDADPDDVIWVKVDKATGAETELGTGYYYTKSDGSPIASIIWDKYAKLVLKQDTKFYIYCYFITTD